MSNKMREEFEFASYLRAKEIFLQMLGTKYAMQEIAQYRTKGAKYLFELAQDIELVERELMPDGCWNLQRKADLLRVEKEVGE